MPRLSVLTVLGRSVPLWVGAIFLIVGLMLTYVAVQEWRTQQQFEQEAVAVQATILSRSIEKATRNGNPRTKYLVTYRFAPSEGQTIEQTGEVSVDEWERLDEGSSFPVRYLASDPSTTHLEMDRAWWEPLIFGTIGTLFAVMGFLVGRSELRHVMLVWRLSRSGLQTEGTVLKVWATGTRINRVRQWQLSYEFRDHMGRTQQGESHLLSPDEAAAWNPGDKGSIRFDRTRPQDSVWIGH